VTSGLGSVTGRVAVVTGAASGIGRATAQLLARRGATLALLDIDGERLTRVAEELRALGAHVSARRVDVAVASEVSGFAQFVAKSFGAAELVVNAAGIVVYGDFLATTEQDLDALFDINVKGTALVCRALLPAMLARGRGGQLVNVASAAAFVTPAGLTAYGATKHALRGLSDGLRHELTRHDIGVSVVCPGFVATPIVEHARLRGHADVPAERARIRAFLRGRGLSAERVAERIVRAAERGQPLVPVGIEAHVLHFLSRAAPGSVAHLLKAAERFMK
jgi:short-subunit dehydrogenase